MLRVPRRLPVGINPHRLPDGRTRWLRALVSVATGTLVIAVVHAHQAGGAPTSVALRAGLPAPALTIPPEALPRLGRDIGEVTRTCRHSVTGRTPTRGADCTVWDISGPVNVVITTAGVSPWIALTRSGWRPARGTWLVADGLVEPHPGCAGGWRDSREQLELRLTPIVRRHLKLIHVQCALPGTVTVFGDAHTDSYDLRSCAGDHLVDLDRARDAVAASLRALPQVSITYRQEWVPGTRYSGGCGHEVSTDGRVAYITIDSRT